MNNKEREILKELRESLERTEARSASSARLAQVYLNVMIVGLFCLGIYAFVKNIQMQKIIICGSLIICELLIGIAFYIINFRLCRRGGDK